ncbi:hypothetical protein SARC_10344 [Sphaeroforma arctica JP610]|uniref:Uncharacterized protein n=1 Tax=Sphaeroforma arctica JP610 TaxID=667725 RepID=A0A0L0FL48_9EUKA|nr:hypothetical protein SARC_10344 [Sphaeroforma arctica JP610]KNC77191.1 hypothetical protein SARC_10344 [Sphaeroforma arctica JP610]|eukprot:XP_014151093.1 hypothetical protein SARC_10344 [Sphaeroforma arctica JP610]
MSYETLNENGNLGSSAILLVLEKVFNTTDAEEVMFLAFGPGVTVEWGMFQRRPTEEVEQVAGGN